jgi:hypothetical protein
LSEVGRIVPAFNGIKSSSLILSAITRKRLPPVFYVNNAIVFAHFNYILHKYYFYTKIISIMS